ncbi:hypothetical protein M426DRAFT_316013 [Hypoxylon sp. CI-4A]|nr:hypothetical protein M426DRAFT_316013 [Hypoxylon sp. CI-4A]
MDTNMDTTDPKVGHLLLPTVLIAVLRSTTANGVFSIGLSGALGGRSRPLSN